MRLCVECGLKTNVDNGLSNKLYYSITSTCIPVRIIITDSIIFGLIRSAIICLHNIAVVALGLLVTVVLADPQFPNIDRCKLSNRFTHIVNQNQNVLI